MMLLIIIMRVSQSGWLAGSHPNYGMVDPLCGLLLPVHVSVGCPRLAGQHNHLVKVEVYIFSTARCSNRTSLLKPSDNPLLSLQSTYSFACVKSIHCNYAVCQFMQPNKKTYSQVCSKFVEVWKMGAKK